MHCDESTQTTVLWRSDARPEVTTVDSDLAKAIAWADAHPCAWDVATQTRSRALGRDSCEHTGWAQRSMAPGAILERVRKLHYLATASDAFRGPATIFTWRARFTLEHYREPGFTGGFFRQHDDKHHRLCMSMDYTPETLDAVVSRFLEWCGRDYKTEYVTLNFEIVRRMDRPD